MEIINNILNNVFDVIDVLNNFYWSYIGWLVICLGGTYLTIASRGLQFRALFNFRKNIKEAFSEAGDKDKQGIHPLKLYFASVGGMVGLGNIAGVSIAIMIGGPGSIFWTILASIFGMLIKYSEIFLGVKYRVKNDQGSFDGGHMYYLKHAFKGNFLPIAAAVLLCIYGVEVYQFLVLVDRIESTFDLPRVLVLFGLLFLVLYGALGGISRLANICSVIMPVFMISYLLMAGYIIACNAGLLPGFFALVMKTAFTGQAEIGGFAGSTLILAAYLGMSKAVYSGDIGVGYDSVVQSETRISCAKRQATLSIYALLSDTIICLLTNTMIGVTGSWYTLNHLDAGDLVAKILGDYFPYSDLFVTCLMFFAGFTTIIAFLAAGMKCAKYLHPRYGRNIYLMYSIFAFILFSNFTQDKMVLFMEFISGLLILINLLGIIKLRKDIDFD